ncbi:MAG: GNAT family N-acetyltransferase [Clostridia bacterium]|nr:GNAT family N-acetyltransferase [Clostridia bacterium]
MIHLETVTPNNWRLGLKVRDDQLSYVSDSAGILARAYAYRESRSRAFVIYSDELPVGMAMYHDWDEEKAYDFSQFFIDQRYQGRGFGYEAAKQILEMMKQDGKYDRVCLCYIEGDDPARKLYEKLGFRHTGEAYEDEITMELSLKQ